VQARSPRHPPPSPGGVTGPHPDLGLPGCWPPVADGRGSASPCAGRRLRRQRLVQNRWGYSEDFTERDSPRIRRYHASSVASSDPVAIEHRGCERRAKRAGQMWPALGPVDARPGERPPAPGGGRHVHSHGFEGELTGTREAVAAVGRREPAPPAHGVHHPDAQDSRQMVVAGARVANRLRFDRPSERTDWCLRAYLSEGLEGHCHVCGADPKETVTALGSDGDQSTVYEPSEVLARGRHAHARQPGQFAGGQGTTVHEGVDHRGTCGVTQESGDCCKVCSHVWNLAPQHFGSHRSIDSIAWWHGTNSRAGCLNRRPCARLRT
jgi:hypothetical protein